MGLAGDAVYHHVAVGHDADNPHSCYAVLSHEQRPQALVSHQARGRLQRCGYRNVDDAAGANLTDPHADLRYAYVLTIRTDRFRKLILHKMLSPSIAGVGGRG